MQGGTCQKARFPCTAPAFPWKLRRYPGVSLLAQFRSSAISGVGIGRGQCGLFAPVRCALGKVSARVLSSPRQQRANLNAATLSAARPGTRDLTFGNRQHVMSCDSFRRNRGL